MIHVLMLCTGNICRSPIAEGWLRAHADKIGLSEQIYVDSAGTTDYHVGEPPDRRAQQVMRARGIEIGGLRARKLRLTDLEQFHYLLAMDDDHLSLLQHSAQQVQSPGKIHRIMAFSPGWKLQEVPDPYYGGQRGFIQVVDMLEAATRGFLTHLRESHFEVQEVAMNPRAVQRPHAMNG
jgi:protein-tyrosine phosphatase